MAQYETFKLAPLPVVDLGDIKELKDGAFLKCSDFCRRAFKREEKCKKHYENLIAKKQHLQITQCPFGFSSLTIHIQDDWVAFTGFIPFPRLGGGLERLRAKQNPEAKITQDSVKEYANSLNELALSFKKSIQQTLTKYPPALHEIRKYNRNIMQEAERLCRKANPSDPDKAESSLVRIWKTAELMSYQFEVIDLLANETLATLERKTDCEVYRILEKCAKIHEPLAQLRGIQIKLSGDSVRARVCDKTFPIIPTVLFENAIKYSLEKSEIRCKIERMNEKMCRVVISNISKKGGANIQNIFMKGMRDNKSLSGDGVGLYLAQLIARQHGSEVALDRKQYGYDGLNEIYEFSFVLDMI